MTTVGKNRTPRDRLGTWPPARPPNSLSNLKIRLYITTANATGMQPVLFGSPGLILCCDTFADACTDFGRCAG